MELDTARTFARPPRNERPAHLQQSWAAAQPLSFGYRRAATAPNAATAAAAGPRPGVTAVIIIIVAHAARCLRRQKTARSRPITFRSVRNVAHFSPCRARRTTLRASVAASNGRFQVRHTACCARATESLAPSPPCWRR